MLLLIFAESAVGFVQSEKLAVGIVLHVQPNSQFKSCATTSISNALYSPPLSRLRVSESRENLFTMPSESRQGKTLCLTKGGFRGNVNIVGGRPPLQAVGFRLGYVWDIWQDTIIHNYLATQYTKRKPSRKNPTRLEEAATYSPT